ncbi:hypothetical protein PAL_GLEAN10015405 [Pteropus alecto]|uniref:Uncharacterized protein n=1 Tax=Pteropus alecto TaxID=9402 RepID=L5KIC2_PTEAL|nr:hypothetical protein PAL_GLEAN10015405 [Pteropus alecto]
MAKDSRGRRPRYQMPAKKSGKEERCARSHRRRKHDRRCRKLLSSFGFGRRTRVVKRRHARNFVTSLCEVASLAS